MNIKVSKAYLADMAKAKKNLTKGDLPLNYDSLALKYASTLGTVSQQEEASALLRDIANYRAIKGELRLASEDYTHLLDHKYEVNEIGASLLGLVEQLSEGLKTPPLVALIRNRYLDPDLKRRASEALICTARELSNKGLYAEAGSCYKSLINYRQSTEQADTELLGLIGRVSPLEDVKILSLVANFSCFTSPKERALDLFLDVSSHLVAESKPINEADENVLGIIWKGLRLVVEQTEGSSIEKAKEIVLSGQDCSWDRTSALSSLLQKGYLEVASVLWEIASSEEGAARLALGYLVRHLPVDHELWDEQGLIALLKRCWGSEDPQLYHYLERVQAKG